MNLCSKKFPQWLNSYRYNYQFKSRIHYSNLSFFSRKLRAKVARCMSSLTTKLTSLTEKNMFAVQYVIRTLRFPRDLNTTLSALKVHNFDKYESACQLRQHNIYCNSITKFSLFNCQFIQWLHAAAVKYLKRGMV